MITVTTLEISQSENLLLTFFFSKQTERRKGEKYTIDQNYYAVTIMSL